jgi:formiminotetrahydrofolate cyclodeaminase
VPYARLSIEQFADALSERTPAPASGSMLAVSGALAAALVEMTARFSDDSDAAEEATRLRTRLLALADEDADAYAEFMDTKSDEARERTIAVPQEIGDRAAAVAHIAQRLEREGNPRLVGDGIAARLVADAVQRGAAQLVELNRAAARSQSAT